jgi:uncharacterized protein
MTETRPGVGGGAGDTGQPDPRGRVPSARPATAGAHAVTAENQPTAGTEPAAMEDETGRAQARRAAPEAEVRPHAPIFGGDSAVLGLPAFIAGSVALGLVLIGAVPATAVGASIPIILSAAAAGLFLATIWAAVLGHNAVAAVFGVFAAFWLSYAVLLLGLLHGWFGITVLALARTQEAFLITWIVVIGLLLLGTLRLPFAYTLIILLVEVALILALIGTYQASSGVTKAAGYVALVFAGVGAIAYLGAATKACGGKALPLGRPVWR